MGRMAAPRRNAAVARAASAISVGWAKAYSPAAYFIVRNPGGVVFFQIDPWMRLGSEAKRLL